MKRTTKPSSAASPKIANVCGDVGMDRIHLTVVAGLDSPFPRVFDIPNRTHEITETLSVIRDHVRASGFEQARVVVEPTGIYHDNLLNIAAHIGFLTGLVNPEHVAKMRIVHFGDSGKTDRRDPEAIAAVVANGRLIVDRRRHFPEIYHLLRDWGSLYQAAEDRLIEAKNRVHRALRQLFPDFDFSSDFLYGPSGQAIMRCYQLDPRQIVRHTPSRLFARLRKHSSMRRSSVDRLLASARASVQSTPSGERHHAQCARLALAWEEWQLHQQRRAAARERLESLYDQARLLDPRLPAPVHRVISKCMLARLFGELGPIDDFHHWRQLLRYAGMNLRERQSGRYVGLIKISRKGRPQLRRVLNQIALPLVRKGFLFGDYFHQKRRVQKMPGPKAMMAVSRKIVKMIWGWVHAGAAFDLSRVFTCKATFDRCAA